MNFKIFKYTGLIIAFGFFSCGGNTEKSNIPKLNFAKEYGIDATQLVYQYYQKFGFNEVCIDLRMVSKLASFPKLNKKLPIQNSDLDKINSFSNKRDRMNGDFISFKSNTRYEFYDIELDYLEFIKDSSLIISLNKGSYEIIPTKYGATLKIFDSESGLFYVEHHQCDGK